MNVDSRPTTIPFFLITGFLGSGKTTLLKRFLGEHADHLRIAVVQNEFADANVDAEELRRTGKPFHMLEMNRGSVFCVCLLADFTKSCAALINEYHPDAVILEATGLADPVAVAQVLEAPELKSLVYLSHTWAVVDASTFLKMEATVKRVKHQVRIADTVIVNKTDLVTPQVLDDVRRRIMAISPHARIVDATHCDISLADAFSPLTDQPLAVKDAGELASYPSAGRPPVASVVVRSTRKITRRSLDAFLSKWQDQCYRVKGYVNLGDGAAVSVQQSFGTVDIAEVRDYSGPTELVALGPDLDSKLFRESFEAACVR
jgi:G3E family GTPase